MEEDNVLLSSHLSEVAKENKAIFFILEKKALRPIAKFVQLLLRIIFKLVGNLGEQVNQLVLVVMDDQCVCSNFGRQPGWF